ncbi:MAG: hypothetical protein AAF763_16755, partial [Pseudomonadota bacterium]
MAGTGAVSLTGRRAALRPSTEGLGEDVRVDGALSKIGEGQARLAVPVAGEGSFDFSQGSVTITDGVVNAAALAGARRVRLDGGALIVSDGPDLQVRSLILSGGVLEILGTGRLTATERLDWAGGAVRGERDPALADGATGRLGPPPPTETETWPNAVLTLDATLAISGEMVFEFAELMLGGSGDSPSAGGASSWLGHLQVRPGGTLVQTGYAAKIIADAGQADSFVNEGEAILPDGALGVQVSLGGGETWTVKNGAIEILGGSVDLSSLGAYEAVIVTGGALIVDQPLSVARLEMRGGALDGTGDIDVSESFVWLDGALGGPGAVRIAPGAAALIGGGPDVEGSVGSTPLTLARTLPVEGEARHRSGLIELGAAGAVDEIGVIDIAPGAVWTFERFDADIAGAPGAANVLRNDGLLRKVGGGVSVADDPNLALEGGGAVEALNGELRVGGQTFGSWPPVEDAPRPGDPLIDGETLTLSAGESLDALTLDCGTLVLDGDARRERPTFVSGVVAGPGDLTLGERFDWEGGRMTGAGATRAEADAAVILGAIWDENSTPEPRTLQLDRTLTLLGDGRLEQARVRLGGTEAEPGAETPSERAGALEIAEGATLDLVGIHSDLSPSRPGAAALVNDGAIRKLGPGASDLGVHVSGEGTVAQTDADGRFHVASGGTLTLDGSEDVDHLVVDGGVLVLGGDVTLASLQLLSGGVEGAGSLDVTDALIWRSGLLSVEGGVDLLAGAQGDFGSGAPPDAPGPGADLDLATTLNLFGDAALRDGRVDLGRRPFDADLLADVTEVGRLHVRDGAELSLIGPAADVASGALGTPFLGAATGSGPQVSFLTDDGVIRREGFGRSQLSGVIQGDCAFVSDRDEPGFEIGDHGALVLDGGLAIDAVHLAGGLLSAEADVALSRLSLEDGLPTGPGDVFVSDRLEVGASSILAGPGRLVLQEGAAGLFGRARDPDAPPSSTFLELSRDLRIEGEAWFEQARVDVSGTVWDPVSAASVYSGGVVEIAPTNVAILHGREVDLRNDGENGVAPLIKQGVLRRTGSGVAEIGLDYSGDGVLDLAGGALAWGRGADLA